MDSMRHLSTSLPTTRRRQDQPELLSDFKAAALSVTNLYKTAAASQDKARQAGYQDALDDLLGYLDKENLGLMDGEGWKVRRWATERLSDEGSTGKHNGSDEEEETDQAENRSSSPEVQKKAPPLPVASSELEDSSPRRAAVSEPPPQQQQPPAPIAVPTMEEFSYRSQQQLPSNHDRETSNMDLDTATSAPSADTVRIIPRNAATRAKHASNARRSNTASALGVNLGSGAGNKRKIPFPDFFDISGVNGEGQQDRERKDGNGGRGGKRGRHV